MKTRISMITLGVSDLEKSIKFYKEGLGFPRKESAPEIAFFTLNGSWLSLYVPTSEIFTVFTCRPKISMIAICTTSLFRSVRNSNVRDEFVGFGYSA